MLILVDIVPPPDVQPGRDSVVERWLKQPGERVALHEPLLEINTDKATVQGASPAGGPLHELLNEPGEPGGAGGVRGHVAGGGGAAAPAAAVTKPPAPTRQPEPAPTRGREADLSPAVRHLVKQHNLDPAKIK